VTIVDLQARTALAFGATYTMPDGRKWMLESADIDSESPYAVFEHQGARARIPVTQRLTQLDTPAPAQEYASWLLGAFIRGTPRRLRHQRVKR
jgi:hypothetical protein